MKKKVGEKLASETEMLVVNYQYEIYPNEEQREKLDTWIHYCRHLYNSALIDRHRMYQEDKTNYSRYDMQKQLVVDKKKFPFLNEGPFSTPSGGFRAAGKSIQWIF